MIYFLLSLIIVIYIICMMLISAYYNKTEPTFINEFRLSWMIFVLVSALVLTLIPVMIQDQSDKQLKINDTVTVKQLYEQGYIVVREVDKGVYNVREIKPHNKPIEEIK